jgi:hypothetical protein
MGQHLLQILQNVWKRNQKDQRPNELIQICNRLKVDIPPPLPKRVFLPLLSFYSMTRRVFEWETKSCRMVEWGIKNLIFVKFHNQFLNKTEYNKSYSIKFPVF